MLSWSANKVYKGAEPNVYFKPSGGLPSLVPRRTHPPITRPSLSDKY